jgi:hypothetical protein
MYVPNYLIEIVHPVTDEIVDARISFDYTAPHRGGYDEPPEYGGVEIIECSVYGEDILKEFSTSQLEALEDEIYAAECEGHYYEPDESYYDHRDDFEEF